jgi:hypothetical protein
MKVQFRTDNAMQDPELVEVLLYKWFNKTTLHQEAFKLLEMAQEPELVDH